MEIGDVGCFAGRDFGHIRFLKVGILIQAKIHGVMEEKNSRIDEIVILHGSKNWVIIAKCDAHKKHGSHNKKCNSTALWNMVQERLI